MNLYCTEPRELVTTKSLDSGIGTCQLLSLVTQATLRTSQVMIKMESLGSSRVASVISQLHVLDLFQSKKVELAV